MEKYPPESKVAVWNSPYSFIVDGSFHSTNELRELADRLDKWIKENYENREVFINHTRVVNPESIPPRELKTIANTFDWIKCK